MQNCNIILFDIDGTIIRGQSQQIFLRYLYSKGILSFPKFIKILIWFVLYKLHLVSNPEKIMRYAYSFMRGMSKTDVTKNIVEPFFRDSLVKYIYNDAVEIIHENIKSGNRVIFVSNLTDLLIEPIASYCRVNEYICTKISVRNNIYTGEIEGDLVYGQKKLSAVLNRFGFDTDQLKNVYFYSDHISDLPLLSMVGHPIATNPDTKLETEAKKLGWKILKFSK